MTTCPKCGSVELRLGPSRVRLSWGRRWVLFGQVIPKPNVVAVNVSCSNCQFVFVSRQDGITADAIQTAFDELKAAQDAARGTGRNTADDTAKREVREPQKSPRLAPDPRARRR